MLSLERIASSAVVKLGRIRHVPSFGTMAVTTITTQFAFMSIGMTGGALVMQYGLQLKVALMFFGSTVDHARMALGAQNIDMLPRERVPGLAVIESGCRFPGNRIVTLAASQRDLTAVFVNMTTRAGGVEAEESATQGDFVPGERGATFDEFLQMTGSTIQRSMLADKRKAGLGMVEIFLSALPVNKVDCPTLMLDVAGLTFPVSLAAVESTVDVEFFLDDRVTDETLVSRQLAIGAMTLTAIFDAFEESVRFMQFTGRQLGAYRGV